MFIYYYTNIINMKFDINSDLIIFLLLTNNSSFYLHLIIKDINNKVMYKQISLNILY